MNLEHYPAERLKKQIKSIFEKYQETRQASVFFFGSRVKGNNFERSDIDLGFKTPKKIPAMIKSNIEDDLEKLPILYKIDLVDFNYFSPQFQQEALKNIEYVKNN